jgi:predicted Rdx family selenoprotein
VSIEIRPGGKGDFKITADGTVVWDKKGREGRFPDSTEILARLPTK